MADEDGLDALVRRVDPDRWLASRFIADRARRADVVALYAFDHELARARIVASNPLIAEIRLTWWREVLDEIHGGGSVRAHPTALALATAVRRRGLPRAPLEAMIDARIEALDAPAMSLDAAERWAEAVGGSATTLAGRVLDPAIPGAALTHSGRAWGLVMLRRAGTTVEGLDARLGQALVSAKVESRSVSAAAFPAIAAVTLARNELDGRRLSGLAVRSRLFLSVLQGSI